jgi:PAS domain S-box-containing protein
MNHYLNPVSPWSWRSLQTRITVLTLTAFLFSIWSLSFFASRILHSDVEKLLSEQQLATASLLASDIHRSLTERLATLETVAQHIPVGSMSNPAALQTFLNDRVSMHPIFNGGFFVTGATGIAVASVPIAAQRMGVSYLDRDHVATALKKGRSAISQPVIGKQLRSPVVSIAVPIRHVQGQVMGCLVGVIDLGKTNFLDQIISAEHGKTGSYMLIANQWRTVVSATNKQDTLMVLPKMGINPGIDRFVQGFEGSAVVLNMYGVEVLASAKRIPVANWSIVASLPSAEAFAPVKNLVRNIALATLTASLLAGMLTWWLLRRKLQPVHHAFQTLVSHAESKQPLQALPQTSEDEVGQLIHIFNDMLITLEQHEEFLTVSEKITHELSERLNEAQQISQLGSWTLDLRSGELLWSNEIYRLFELDLQPFNPSYDNFLNAIHPDDRAAVNQAYTTSLLTQTPYQIEHRLHMADGRIKWVHQRCRSEFDEGGKALRSMGTMQDITERKLAETALSDARTLLMTVLDTIPMRVFWKDRELNYLGCNTEFARDAGFEHPSDIIGKDDFQMKWKTQADTYRQDDRSVMESGIAKLFYDESATTPDGRIIWQRISKIPLKNQTGAIFGVMGIYEDVTQRKQAKEQLRKLSRIAEQSPESLVVTDTKGNIEYVNEAFIQNTGYSREEAVGQNPRILNSGQTPAATFSGMWKALTDGHNWSGQLTNRRKDGSIYIEWVIISPLRNTEGIITHYVAVKQDITEKKRMGQELDQHRHHLENLVELRTAELNSARLQADAASRSKSEFLANMSHEIRTPMNGIMGMVDLIEQTRLTSEQRRMLATINSSSVALLSILNDILDFSKIEAGKLDIEQVPICLRDVIENAALLMQNVASHKEAEISLFIDPTLPEWIISDPTRLRQILHNLLGNALKFVSDRVGHAMLHVQPVTQVDGTACMRLSVIDNGIGMSPEVLDKLYQPFTQADSSTMRRFGGTGLGLSITRRLIDMLHGSITVQSTVGMGSEFTVEIPLQIATPPADYLPPDLPDLHGVHVLAVTPSMADMTMFQTYLGAAGAQVVAMSNISAAHQCMAQSPRDTVLLLGVTQASSDDSDLQKKWTSEYRPHRVRVVRLVHRGRFSTDAGVIEVLARPLLYHDLLRGVAVASGRLSTLIQTAHDRPVLTQRIAPGVEEAVQNGTLILMAEDNETNRDVMQAQLHLLGYACEVAFDGDMALTMWRTGRYALLLTDCHMPKMDGFELTTAIRQNEPPGTHLPIIAVTANAMHGEAARCKAHGMDDYLSKPLRTLELRGMLARWLPLPVIEGENTTTLIATNVEPARVTGHFDIWNSQTLGELVGHNLTTHKRLLKRFLDNAPQQCDAIVSAAEEGDFATLNLQAHTLKSAARSVGALALGELCQSIESASRPQDRKICASMAQDLPSALDTVNGYIKDHLAVLNSTDSTDSTDSGVSA